MNKVILSDKDRQILLDLWIWKFLTTAIIEGRYYPNSKGQGAYRRLKRLDRGGLINSLYTNCGKHVFWTLTGAGFKIIRDSLGNLKEVGFKSEFPIHDFYCSAFHLGEWAYEKPSNVEFFSEQQLRRFHYNEYPDWVLQTDLHRPDGYWRIKDGPNQKIVAIEIELNQKSENENESVANFYNEEGKTFDVFWVVVSQKQAQKANSKISSVVGSEEHNHSFLLLSDFLKYGWNASFIIGKYKGDSVKTALGCGLDTGCTTVFKNPFFETNKARVKSITNKKLDSIKMLIADI
jgi:hypothetical protein